MVFSAVVIIGPTASGKTAIAHDLARGLRNLGTPVELVNLDAFQFYRGVTAGTAKPEEIEQQEFNYHCLNLLEPHEDFDAPAYAKIASEKCREIEERGALPICVGGSGLYLRAFLHGLDPLPPRHPIIRNFLRENAAAVGWPELHRWLAVIDQVRASELSSNDGVRIERALEIFLQSGEPPSSQRSRMGLLSSQKNLFDAFVIHVDLNDQILRERIFRRVPELFARGWLREVAELQNNYGERLIDFQSMKAIGYKDVLEYLSGGANGALPPPADLCNTIVTHTWQYARRQRTWNRKEQCDVRAGIEGGVSANDLLSLVLAWQKNKDERKGRFANS